MNSREWNERVARVAREQPLPGAMRNGGGSVRHRWKVTVEREGEERIPQFDFGINPLTGKPYFDAWVFKKPGKSADKRLYRVYVGSGCVNEEPAAIEYLTAGDPRAWTMSENYGPYLRQQRMFGSKPEFVDRPLWDGPERPYLHLTVPTVDGTEMGGFARTADRRRPEMFRTAEMWERELYQASVYVTVSPFTTEPAAVSLRLGGARDRRWRVFCGQLPSEVSGAGAAKLASCEIARIWLSREPGTLEGDELYVEQLEYWDLAAKTIFNKPLLELVGLTAEAVVGVDLGLLAMGLTGVAVGAVLVGIEAGVVAIILANIEAIIAAVSQVGFWSV